MTSYTRTKCINGGGCSGVNSSDPLSVDACQSRVLAPSQAPVVSLSKKHYPHCLVLIGSSIERDLHKQNVYKYANACLCQHSKIIMLFGSGKQHRDENCKPSVSKHVCVFIFQVLILFMIGCQ